MRQALEYQRWFRGNGGELLANRILLPAAGHFEQVAAFLSAELLRNEAAADLARAFARTEPLIDLAIQDLQIADETFVGLCGEMLLLHALLRESSADRVAEVLESWKGHRETARDFQLGPLGVEVKTTTGATSSHLFRGVHQLEIGHGVDGIEETEYKLVSVGIEWAQRGDDANTTSLPEIVDGVLEGVNDALGDAAPVLISDLLSRIADYGAPTAIGYRHATMAKSARFSGRLRLVFARGYDLADDAIRLLSTDDMRARPFIEADSLSLRVDLPDQVRGDVNPIVGLANLARRIMGAE